MLANAIVADFTRTLGRTAWLPDVAAVAPRPRVAGGRNDLLDGGAGNDTYQFAIGGGDDIIDQNAVSYTHLTLPTSDLV